LLYHIAGRYTMPSTDLLEGKRGPIIATTIGPPARYSATASTIPAGQRAILFRIWRRETMPAFYNGRMKNPAASAGCGTVVRRACSMDDCSERGRTESSLN
jgi:hypothetical protein